MPRRRQPPRRRIPPLRRPLTDEQRGYGRNHRRTRREVAKQVDAGRAVCWRCGRWIAPGTPWHLGHRDDVPGAKARGIYAGPEHQHCSNVSGGWKAQGYINPPMAQPSRPPAKALSFFDTTVPSEAAGDDEQADDD